MSKIREIQKQGYLIACEALMLRRAGMTFREIGKLLGGVSETRARQLVTKGERIERHPEHFGGHLTL